MKHACQRCDRRARRPEPEPQRIGALPLARWGLLFTLLAGTAMAQTPAAAPLKTLRIAFAAAETGFDPARAGDTYSYAITSHIFESLYRYDHLARPVKIRPLVAAAMPEATADFRTWTIRLRPDVYFADDPAFKGVPRQMVAQDWVYTFKRYADPALNSPNWSDVESAPARRRVCHLAHNAAPAMAGCAAFGAPRIQHGSVAQQCHQGGQQRGAQAAVDDDPGGLAPARTGSTRPRAAPAHAALARRPRPAAAAASLPPLHRSLTGSAAARHW